MRTSFREGWERFVSFIRRGRLDDDFEEELAVSVEFAAEENRRRGMSAEEVRRQALIELGGIESAKERHRDARGLPWLENLLTDLRYTLRQLRKSPGFTAIAILSLGLGIGGTTAMFSLVYAVLLHPYPYAGADRMIRILTEDPGGTFRAISLTGAQWQTLRESDAVAGSVAWQNWELNTTGSNLPEDVKAVFITPNASPYFGIRALRGRGLVPSDAPAGQNAQPVVVLSYLFWQRHFAGRPDVLGRTLAMAHKDYTIVGVMPPQFTWNGGDVYLPLKIQYGPIQPYGISVKLKPGVNLQAANAELQALFQQFAKETPAHFPEKFHVHAEWLNSEYVHTFGRMLPLLFGAVVFLLLIGCANVSILLLSRGMYRRLELAIRAALGAGRARILRQLITESVLLSLGGAGLGLLMAYSILPVVLRWMPLYAASQETVVKIHPPVLLFCIGLALLTGLFSGLSPALRMSRPELAQTMQAGAHRIAGSTKTRRTYQLLIAGQLALTMVLLACAGTAAESLARLMHIGLGYDPHNTVDIDIPLHNNTYTNWVERASYFEHLQDAITSIPGTTQVAIASHSVPPTDGLQQRFEIRGKPAVETQQSRLNLVSANYFSTLHVALLRGRVWNRTENMRAVRVAVVNQAMARQYWPHGDAIGSTIRMPELHGRPPFGLTAPHSDDWFQIVGVVGNSRNDGLLAPVKPAVYLPYTFLLDVDAELLVRTRVPPLSLLHAIRTKVHLVDSDQQVGGYSPTLEDLIEIQPERKQEQLAVFLFGAFAALALLLAMTGLYSVVSNNVAQRTNEFGIRMALGAQRSDVLWIVLRSTWLSMGIGMAVGLASAFIAENFMTKWTGAVSGSPFILASIVLLLSCVSTCACLIPARRASSIDPMTALRQE